MLEGMMKYKNMFMWTILYVLSHSMPKTYCKKNGQITGNTGCQTKTIKLNIQINIKTPSIKCWNQKFCSEKLLFNRFFLNYYDQTPSISDRTKSSAEKKTLFSRFVLNYYGQTPSIKWNKIAK